MSSVIYDHCRKKKAEIIKCVADKHAAKGTPNEEYMTELCSRVIFDTRMAYIEKTKSELKSMKKGSKLWWKKVAYLMGATAKDCNIPALKDDSGEWVMDSPGKANLIGKTLVRKNVMAEIEENNYSRMNLQRELQEEEALPTAAMAFQLMNSIREDSGTGPDGLPARIIKYCAAQLAYPVAILAMRIILLGVWPQSWREHWIIPLFKKGSTYAAENYRGIHLTAQLSKVVERLVKRLLQPYLERTIGFGPNQFAYRCKRGARDALAFLTIEWIAQLNRRGKVAVYCSDVSGAFDRVETKRLLEKLKAKGVNRKLRRLISSWLEERRARIMIGGDS